MPIAITSPSRSIHPNPSSGHKNASSPDVESSNSKLPTDADISSSSSLVSPMGTNSAPFSPIAGASGSDTPAEFSPQPSVSVSNVAVDGSAPPSFIKGIGLRLKDGQFGGWAKGNLAQSSLADEPLREDNEEMAMPKTSGDDPRKESVDGLARSGSSQKQRVVEKIQDRPIGNRGVIAVDFDDVCAQYIPTLAANHNAKYGTNLTVEDFQTYSFFQNKGWGTPAETQRKLGILDSALPHTAPVKGFASALRALHALGHPLHIVTARPEMFKDCIKAWLAGQGITVGVSDDDVIAAIWCCSTYAKEPLPERRDTWSGLQEEKELNERLLTLFTKGKTGGSKLKMYDECSTGIDNQVLRAINASLFIDDNYGNLESIATAHPPIPCLLFGDYPWNRVRSGVASPAEMMTFEERTNAGLDITVEDIVLGLNLYRVNGWEDVVEWVKKWDVAAGEGIER